MKGLDIGVFRHMKICCPYCKGLPAGCEECNETGLCCPTCNGQGEVIRLREARVGEVLLCPTCQMGMSDGAQYDELSVNRAIDRYIEDWFAGRIEDPVLTRQKVEDADRRERDDQRRSGSSAWKHG